MLLSFFTLFKKISLIKISSLHHMGIALLLTWATRFCHNLRATEISKLQLIFALSTLG